MRLIELPRRPDEAQHFPAAATLLENPAENRLRRVRSSDAARVEIRDSIVFYPGWSDKESCDSSLSSDSKKGPVSTSIHVEKGADCV